LPGEPARVNPYPQGIAGGTANAGTGGDSGGGSGGDSGGAQGGGSGGEPQPPTLAVPQSRAGCGRCDVGPGEGVLGGAALGLLAIAGLRRRRR
jgi:MYXO-CTERM domain-containing protein